MRLRGMPNDSIAWDAGSRPRRNFSVKFLFPSVVTNGHTKHFMTPRENALLAGIHPFRKWLPNINSFVSIKLA